MSRLTKVESAAHERAERLLEQGSLTDDERLYVIEHWQESATSVNTLAGAFFTPWGLARDFAVECNSPHAPVLRVLDLCAGFGTLSLAVHRMHSRPGRPVEVTCVEASPEYARVGRLMLPEARWIQSSVFDLPDDLELFDVAITNPPFGRLRRDGGGRRYAGPEFEYHVLDVAARYARRIVAIIPQASAPFRYSSQGRFEEERSHKLARFERETGIALEPGYGVDASLYQDEWHGVAPHVEVVTADVEAPTPVDPGFEHAGALFDLVGPTP